MLALHDVVLEGVTAYQAGELDPIYRPWLGQRISLSKLYEFVDAITEHYRADGYALTYAVLPPQDVTAGIVRIQVIEGYIDTVETKGAYRESSATAAIIDRLRHYRPLNIKDLEHDILLLNDLAGVSVQAVLKPSAAGEKMAPPPPGATDMALVFEDVPGGPGVSMDNFGTRYTGPYQVGVTEVINHLLGPYQQTSLSGGESVPANNLKYLLASHRIPLDGYGTTVTLQGSYAHSEPGFRLTPENIVSDSYDYGISLAHPLLRSRTKNLYIGADVAAKDIATDALDSPLSRDRLRIADVSASYDFVDGWAGSNLGQLKLSQGFDILGATKTGSLDLSRANGHSDFTRLTGNASRVQAITGSWRVYLAGTGQYAWEPLLSSEQFGFGGQQFGRAYNPSELTADNGVAATVELRYSLPPLLPAVTSELFTFWDGGRAWNYGDIAHAQSAASAGIGIRFVQGDHVSGSLTLAQPLTKSVAAPEYGNGKDPAVLISLNFKF